MAAAHFLVSGKVQGVFFRASTRERAMDLGLSGRATNLPDGRVDVIAEGDAAALDALQAWLHEGPAAAQVDSVVREAWTGPVNEGFVTG
ncbi:acylphosphatase [Pseudoxanthomonas japonensis]|jgi:acylphosphatase|uniref:acylphosphatase n=1 Tax=Pseudoxanthomonas TaxID=83618 RepID=UPI000783028A|nr:MULTISPECIES: acylphosphatase [Pseudoxanthomonas]MBA3928462.1 acylphosphatase [Xanthomonas sp.]MBL8255930.1 acylphosphatase [Pseudoxanthomonas mexicana]MDR7069395.1 acylphosphatase [Pseudoxanthomonas japonensis]